MGISKISIDGQLPTVETVGLKKPTASTKRLISLGV